MKMDISNLPIVNTHFKKAFVNPEMYEPLVKLLMMRKNQKFQGVFKICDKKGKIVNYVCERQHLKLKKLESQEIWMDSPFGSLNSDDTPKVVTKQSNSFA